MTQGRGVRYPQLQRSVRINEPDWLRIKQVYAYTYPYHRLSFNLWCRARLLGEAVDTHKPPNPGEGIIAPRPPAGT